MKRFFVVTLFVVLPLLAAADFSIEKWQYERPVILPVKDEVGYVRLKLDRLIAGGSAGWKDIRVIKEGKEVPYQLTVETAEVRAQYLSSQVIDTGSDSSGRLQFILDVGKSGSLHSRLHIETDSQNYKRQVRVYAASSLLPHSAPGWDLLTDKGYIFKFTDVRTGFSTDLGEVSYPESSARYLRVVVEAGVEGPLSLRSASIYRYEISSAKEETESLPADIMQRTDDQTTEVVVDLGRGGIPTHRIALSVSDGGNFSRNAYLFGSSDGTNWSRVGQGHLSQIETAKFSGRSLSIEYPESVYRFYKVSIQNFDDAPLQVKTEVELTHIVRTIVFEADPKASYLLYYGNPSSYAPRYDLSRYFEYLETTSLPSASLGTERDNAQYVAPAAPVVPFTDRNKVLLNVTLALLVLLAVLLIGWYIWRHRRSESPVLPTTLMSGSTPPVSPPPSDTEPPSVH